MLAALAAVEIGTGIERETETVSTFLRQIVCPLPHPTVRMLDLLLAVTETSICHTAVASSLTVLLEIAVAAAAAVLGARTEKSPMTSGQSPLIIHGEKITINIIALGTDQGKHHFSYLIKELSLFTLFTGSPFRIVPQDKSLVDWQCVHELSGNGVSNNCTILKNKN